MFNVNIAIEANMILGSLTIDSFFFEKSKYDYAFYLYKNDQRVDTVWYSDRMEVTFDVNDLFGDFYIRAFIRDKEYRNIRFFNSEKLIVKTDLLR